MKDPEQRNQPETIPAQGETQEGVPRMPHERDESGSSQANDTEANGRLGRVAKEDVDQGRQDTSKGQELDAAYQKQREGTPQPDRKFAP